MPNAGDEFEEHVQLVYDTLLNQGDRGTRVSRGLAVKDTRGRIFHIDVYYEFTMANVVHRVAIECKDTSRPIGRDDAIAFKGKLDDLPSTVGVFVSRHGYQKGAAEYLDDHGILRLSESDLPTLPQVVADAFSRVVLPDESAVGAPFWILMEVNIRGQNTGTYFQRGNAGQPFYLPFYASRLHAHQGLESLVDEERTSYAVRGLTQRSLIALLMLMDSGDKKAALMSNFGPLHDGTWAATMMTPREVADEYVLTDLTEAWRERDIKSARRS